MSRTAGLRGLNRATMPHHLPNLRSVLQSELPAPSAPFDYGEGIAFPMAGNDQVGDCAIAGLVHLEQIQAKIAGTSYTYPGDQAVLDSYFSLTGGQDTGLQLAQVIGAWSSRAGLLGSRCVAAAAIDCHDEELMARALYSFGALYVGVALPSSAEAQFESHHPWTLGGDMRPVGGHCVLLSGAGSLRVLPSHRQVGDFAVVTWGAETEATDNWWRYFGDQAFVVVTETMADSGHDAVRSLDLAEMRAAVRDLAEAA